MNGAVHDFVVINTLEKGSEYPTGHGGNTDTVATILGKDFKHHYGQAKKQFKKVLEIGSLDICGSMRTYDFVGKGPKWLELIGSPEYIGIDITAGRSVDIVMDAHDIKFPDESFDMVICLEMLEHDTDTQKTLQEAYRVLEKGGLFLLSTVDENHPEHGSGPGGYYRHLTEQELKGWLEKAGFKGYFNRVDTALFFSSIK